MELRKIIDYVNPFHSDVITNPAGVVIDTSWKMTSVKRWIAGGFELLTVALATITLLTFYGHLPIGFTGLCVLTGATTVAFLVMTTYVLGLLSAKSRSNNATYKSTMAQVNQLAAYVSNLQAANAALTGTPNPAESGESSEEEENEENV